MTPAKSWSVDQGSLQGALQRFYATDPATETRERVKEWLKKLRSDPLRMGQEDPDHPGIFFGRIVGTNVGVLYLPNTDEMIVYVSDISGG